MNFKSKILCSILSAALISTALPIDSVLANEDTVSSFYNDFEQYSGEKEFTAAYESDSSSRHIYFMKDYTGNAAVTNNALVAGNENPYKESASKQEADGTFRPAGYFNSIEGSYKFKFIDNTKFVHGGLDGYVGVNSQRYYPVFYGASDRNGIAYADDLTVVKSDDGNNRLVLAPFEIQNTTYSNFSIFGKENVELAGRISKLSLNVNIEDDTNAEAFRISIVKNSALSNQSFVNSYEWMNYNTQFFMNKGMAWYDCVTFLNGKIYLGDVGTNISELNDDNVVCDYEVGKNYDLEYCINLTDLNNPRQMLTVYDENGNIMGELSNRIILTDTTTTTLNSDTFHNGAVGSADRGPTKNTFFRKFDESSTYSFMLTHATAISSKQGQITRASVDNFGLDAAVLSDVDISTQADEYISNPIPFRDPCTVSLEFNYDIINPEITGDITVLDSQGETVDCGKSIDGKVLNIDFKGNLAPSTNYYVHIPQSLESVAGNLGTERVITVRTKDVLDIKAALSHISGDTYNVTANISNGSDSSMNLIVVAVVKKDGAVCADKLYYTAASVASGANADVTVKDIAVPSGAQVETFYLDSFDGLNALCDKIICK